MLVRDERRVSKVDRLGRTWHVHVLILACDQCGTEFERSGTSVLRHIKRKFHFCTRDCFVASSKKGGVIRDLIEKTCVERFGASSPLGSKACQEKSKQTCIEKYGVHHTGAAKVLIEKREKTSLERYGKTSFLATDECRDILRSEDVVKRHRESYQLVDWKTRNARIHATMKRNGTYAKSKAEDNFHSLLLQKFGESDVTRQVTMNGWPIDFYVKSIDTYIQFDGVYWHGLDRPIEAIVEHKTSRDVIIHKKLMTDISQNEWFAAQGFRLIRVTDVEFKRDAETCVARLRRFT